MTSTRRLVVAWITGVFLLLGLPVTASAATSPVPAPQISRPSGIGDTPWVRADRHTDPRLARPVESPRQLDMHPALVPTVATLPAPGLLGITPPAADHSANSVGTDAARGRGPPAPVTPSAGPLAFLGRPDVSGALGDPTD